jgi:ribonuclease T1
LASIKIVPVLAQLLTKLIRHGPVARFVVLTFLSLWLSGCGGLVTVVTATLPPAGPATQAAQAADVTDTPLPSRTPRATRTSSARATRTPSVTATAMDVSAGATAFPDTIDGFRVVSSADLPPEAQHTLDLIDQGGPFPYKQDGVVFQNREGYLPHERANYYHEYTVVTPGSPDRGARRIITGASGEIYYTDDHYATFVRVIQP